MFRSLFVVATVVCAAPCASAIAQVHGPELGDCGNAHGGGPDLSMRSSRTPGRTRSHWAGNQIQFPWFGSHRSNYRHSRFGFGIGAGGYPGYGYSGFGYWDPYRFDGYGYDPYRYGRFRAPDLLDDPYIRARTRPRFPSR